MKSSAALPVRRPPWTGIAVGVAINAAILIAFRGQIARVLAASGFSPHWPDLSLIATAGPAVQVHVIAAVLALAVALFLLSGAKGTRIHRIVGWSWAAIMMTVAVSSFFILELGHGRPSFIHLLSGWTAFAVPMGVWAARTHRIRLHRQTMTGMVVGGLLIAGAFTFIPGRLMWRVFFG